LSCALGALALLSPLFGTASSTTVQTIVAEADASAAEAHPDRNFGGDTSLRVDGTRPVTNAYFRFDLSAVTGSIDGVTLRLYVENGSREGFEVHAVADSSWDESRLTWSNAPSFGPVLGSSGPVDNEQWASIDVTQLARAGGLVTVAITSPEAAPLTLASREAGSSEAPRLAIETTASSPPTNTTPPSISGQPIVGATLSAAAGDWTGTAPISFAYQWQRCDSSGANCTALPGATDSSYVVSWVDVGATLRVAVTGSNAAGAATATSSATTVVTALESRDTTAPSVPSGLAVGAVTQSSISLSWAASSDDVGVAGYDVFVDGLQVDTSTATGYTFSGLACGISYMLGVDAYDAAGNHSSASSVVAATSACADTVAPTAPGDLAVTGTTSTSISLSWSASFDDVGVSGYDVFVDGLKVDTSSATGYTFSGLACGISYTLGVDAYDAAGNHSSASSVVAATSACADTVAPTAPGDLAVTGTTSTSISLSWSASFDDVGVSGYDVFLDGSKMGPTALTNYVFGGLTCGTGYTLGVEAFDAAGNHSTLASLRAGTSSCSSATDPVIAAAGDICNSATSCAPTADLLDAIKPDGVLTLGDNAYNSGTLTEYNTYYRPNWGRQDAIVYPNPGNHEYDTTDAQGYFDYFGARAPGPYYSYDLGSWHLLSLNSELSVSVGSAQETWLKADLAAHPAQCVLAYWHRPRFSSGSSHGSSTTYATFWNDLYAAGAEIVLNGHEHNYERFAPQNPSAVADPKGIREFVVGTGGASHYSFDAPIANSEVRDNTSFGVLKLTLHPDSYDWQFVPVAGASFTDSGSTSCH
jgi:chitodextrinase